MNGLGKNWNGRVFGTNTGNVALSVEGKDDQLTGTIRLNDDALGIAVYDITGAYNEGSLTLTGTAAENKSNDVELGELTVNGKLVADGRLVGEWSTTLGTGGTFQLWPHTYQVKSNNSDGLPEQINTSTISLGAVRLYADDVRKLIGQIVKDFSQKRAVVTYYENGNEKTVYSDHFEMILDELPELSFLKISIQEPELYGVNRNVTVELVAWGENSIKVQSVQESWAIGKAEALSRFGHGFQRKLATQFRKFGLTVNIIITIIALAALPGLPTFWQRLLFAASVLGIQSLITYLHRKYVPNFILFPAQKKANLLGRLGPGFVSWGLTVIGAVAAALIYGLLNGELGNPPVVDFFNKLIF